MNLFNRIIQTFLSKAIITIITFVLSILIVKIVGAEGQGLITLFYTLFLFLSTFFMFSLGSGTIFYVNKFNNISKYFSSFFFLAIFLTVLVLFFCFLFKAQLINNFLSYETEEYFYLGFCLLIVFNLSKISATFSRSLHNSNLYNGAVVLEKIFYLIIIFSFFILDLEISFVEIIYSFIVSSFLVHLFVIFYFKENLNYKLIRYNKIKQLLEFSLKGHLGVVVQKLNLKFDIFYLAYLFPAEIIGYYSISIYFSQILLYIPDSISVFLYPQLSKKKDEISSLETTLTINRILFSLLIMIALTISVFAKSIIIYLYGIDFIQSYIPLLLLLIGSIFFASIKILTKLSTSIGHPLVGSKISIIGIVTNIPLLIFLVPRFDIVGAALASLISYFIMYVFILFWLYNKFPFVRLTDILFLKKSDLKLCSDLINRIRLKRF